MDPRASKSISDILDEVDNYAQTLEALIAFSHHIRSTYSGEAWIGRKMQLDEGGKPGKEISPDLMVEIGNYGLVAEVKQSLPKDSKLLDKLLEQIKKYDGSLHGWSTDHSTHDVTLMANQLVSYKAATHVQESIKNTQLVLTKNFSVIAYNRNSQRQMFIFLKKENGSIAHNGLNDSLTAGVSVALQYVIGPLSSIKFYDSEPREVYTMAQLWDHVFQRLVDHRKTREQRTPEVEVSLDHLLEELRTYFSPPGNRDVIKRQWVKRAMDAFVRIGLAKHGAESDRYIVFLKRISGMTPLEYFTKELYAESQIKLDKFTGAQLAYASAE